MRGLTIPSLAITMKASNISHCDISNRQKGDEDMKKKIQKIGSTILCMTLLGNAIVGSIPNGKVQAAQQYKEVYCDDFENEETYDTHASTDMTSSNVLEEKTNQYFKFTVTDYVSLKTAPIEVTGGKEYRLSYRIHVPQVDGSVHIRPIYQEWNESNNSWSKPIDESTPQSCKIETKTDGWQTHSMTFTPSTDKDHVHFFFEQAYSGYAEVWLDDIEVRAVDTGNVVYSEDFSRTQQLDIQDKKNDTLMRSWETETLHDYALKMDGAKNGYTVKTPGFPIDGGERYKLTYKMKVSNMSGSNCFYPWFQEWYVKNGAEGGWDQVFNQTPDENKCTKETDGWVQQEIIYIPSKDMTHMQFFFEKAWSGSTDVELDDIVVTKVSDGTVVYEQNFNTKNKLNDHSVTDSVGSQSFTEQGNHCLKLSGKGEVQTPICRLENGKKYILSFRVKIENADRALFFRPTYQEWYNNGTYDGDYLTYTDIPDDCVRKANTNGWEEIRLPFSFTDHRNMIQFFLAQWADATADIYIDDVKILEVIETSSKVDTNMSFSHIGESQEWYFNASNISDLTAQYYATTMYVDGTQRRVNVEKSGTKLVIWASFFEGEIAPEADLVIPAGTLLSQVDMNSDRWNAVEGGEKVTITSDLKVAYVDNAWQEYNTKSEKTRYVNLDVQGKDEYISGTIETTSGTHVEKYIQTKMNGQTSETVVAVANGNIATTMSWKGATGEEWYFAIEEAVTTTGYYMMPAMVDGVSTSVVISLVKGQKFGTIYAQSGWFALGGSHIPTKSMKFEAGAVAKQVDVDHGCVEISGASPLQLTKDCELLIEKTLVQRVSVLYKTGDAHLDDTQPDDTDLDDTQPDNVYNSMDLVAMKKIAADTTDKTTDLAELRAADVNGSGKVDTTDLAALRGQLVGKIDIRYDSKINAMYNGVMPIIGYDGPDYDSEDIDGKGRGANGFEPNMITEDVYSKVEEMGFNTVVTNRNEIGTSDDIAFRTLELAEKHGLKVYLQNGYVSDHNLGDKQASTLEDLVAINQKYEQYESFLGYYLCDEPKKAEIENYETPFGLLKNYTNLSGYMNLYPCNSGTLRGELDGNRLPGLINKDNYKGYLEEANKKGADFLSYDMYLRDNNYDIKKKEFYTNLKWSGDVAKKIGKPFYAFVQVGTGFKENQSSATAQEKLTTVQEMYLEANAALAMGAKGLNYYSLMQPIKFARYTKKKEVYYDLYRCGLITIEGKLNCGENGNANYDYYAAAKKINTYVAKIDEVLMHADHKAVIATEKTVAEYVGGVTSYGSLASVTCGDSVLVGCFDYYGREAYLVVSTSCDDKDDEVDVSQDVTLNFNTNTSYSYVGMDYNDNGHTGSGTLNLTNLGSGEAVLVVMDE